MINFPINIVCIEGDLRFDSIQGWASVVCKGGAEQRNYTGVVIEVTATFSLVKVGWVGPEDYCQQDNNYRLTSLFDR